MLIKEEILREAFDDFRFADYPYNDSLKAVLQAMDKYAEEVLKIAAEKAAIGMKKKSQYGKYRKWQKVTEEEVDLSDYEVQYFVDKSSILNCLK